MCCTHNGKAGTKRSENTAQTTENSTARVERRETSSFCQYSILAVTEEDQLGNADAKLIVGVTQHSP
jgi:hypothetical protein